MKAVLYLDFKKNASSVGEVHSSEMTKGSVQNPHSLNGLERGKLATGLSNRKISAQKQLKKQVVIFVIMCHIFEIRKMRRYVIEISDIPACLLQ